MKAADKPVEEGEDVEMESPVKEEVKEEETEFEVGPIMNNDEALNKAQTWINHNKPGEGYEFTGEWQTREGTSFCKFRQEKSDGLIRKFYFIYDPVVPEMGKCEWDNKWGPVKVHCPCGKASYCCEEHMQKDEQYHKNTCTYQEQLDLATMFTGVKVAGAANGVMGLNNLGNTCYMNSAI